MCFYDSHRFQCADWKWGHFRQHCNREYRIGETCGLKLVHNTIDVGKKCPICEKIDTKERKIDFERQRISRWKKEGGKFRASIECSDDMIKKTQREIHDLQYERTKRNKEIGR